MGRRKRRTRNSRRYSDQQLQDLLAKPDEDCTHRERAALAALGRRFWSKVRQGSGCWEFQGAIHKTGYGVFKLVDKTFYAHRIAYLFDTRKPIPEGMELDHLCRNRKCCFLAHLEVVTHRENTLRNTSAVAKAYRKARGLEIIDMIDVV